MHIASAFDNTFGSKVSAAESTLWNLDLGSNVNTVKYYFYSKVEPTILKEN